MTASPGTPAETGATKDETGANSRFAALPAPVDRSGNLKRWEVIYK